MKNLCEKHFDGAVILFTEAIGDAIIALPALRAIQAELEDTHVLLVASAFIKALFKNEFRDWDFQIPEQIRELTFCQTLIDTRCMSWSVNWIKGIDCNLKIGIDLQDRHLHIYDHLVGSGPFADDTSACELFNPIARFLNPTALIESIPRLKVEFLPNDAVRIGLVPGAGCIAKRWPRKNFLLVEEWANRNGIETVWFLGPKEADLKAHQSLHKCTLRCSLESSKLLDGLGSCRAVVSNDTALMHLSAAIGVTTLGIFGPSLPGQWFPYNAPSKYFQHPNAGTEKGIVGNPDKYYTYWPESVELIAELENLFNR